MEDPGIVFRRLKRVFTVGCFLSAIYTTVLLTERYIANNDSSVIVMNNYNKQPQDRYPTFSVCFIGTRFHWFHDHNIFARYGINATQYQLLMKGENATKYEFDPNKGSYSRTPVLLMSDSKDEFEQFHLQISNALSISNFYYENPENDILYNSSLDSTSNPPSMYLSYQSADKICFTRNETDLKDSTRIHDILTFDSSAITNLPFIDTEIEIYIHYPDQLLFSFSTPYKNPKYKANFSEFYEYLNNGSTPTVLNFMVSQCKVLRKRHGSNTLPCNEKIASFDHYLHLKIAEYLGCIPVYFKHVLSSDLNIQECNTAKQFKDAYEYLKDFVTIVDSNDRSCEEMLCLTRMSLVTDILSVPREGVSIMFSYPENYYEEIRYIDSFGFESFGSGVGGFIGIFLGFSFFQLPDFVAYIATAIVTLRKRFFNGRF